MRLGQYDHIYQLTFLPKTFPVNCYLVEEEKELTLVDAALPYSHKGILKTASQIGKPISRIVLTHAHDDHVGALDALKQALPDAEVFISERDARLLAGDKSLDPNEPQTPIKGGVPKSLKTRADTLLTDGDQIGSLTAVMASGHTPGSMAFLDERTRALIGGDTFQTRGGIAVAGKMKPTFPFPALGTWDKATAIESARKLLDLKPSLLAIGHGTVLTNPLSRMEQAIEEAEKNLVSV
ncbi:MBL fold metallo-hydrolase [Pseudalkalibacillus caeni]|uniref:MBL fold metallo-hydrolase n=1 Tax=Exobacillus caeni TaxID=2574798 RepID=A0A5R9F6H2_9BACL|nr:MBL fold metallo-hydrolase [Pseudalkalibacillus caeni]TLS36423.1 MBL fold metallo-hydrolase [Pseudalkalibacillus caeni]